MIAVILVDDLILLTLIMLVSLAGVGWWTERSRRKRIQRCAQGVERIYDLAAQAQIERSLEKCNRVNQMIDQWNSNCAAEIGRTIPNIDCSGFK